MLRRFWEWITGKARARRMLDEFVQRFPDRCPICSHHRYGLRHGHTSEPEAGPHYCPERKDAA
jgi:hypothetical protein